MDSSTTCAKNAPIYIRVIAPRCPMCGGDRLRANHTERRPSGAKVRHSRCQDCGQKVRVVVE